MYVAILAQSQQKAASTVATDQAQTALGPRGVERRNCHAVARRGELHVRAQVQRVFARARHLLYVEYLSVYLKAACLRKDSDQGSKLDQPEDCGIA